VVIETLHFVPFSTCKLGITAGTTTDSDNPYPELSITITGYHRLWSHRSYNASPALQYVLILAGVSAVQGSCLWWARKHRSHHRHTDTDLDPYNANRGLLWTHIGWMIVESDLRSGSVDTSDLRNDALIQWQHRWYFPLMIFFGYLLPTIIPGLLWGDWNGGFFLAGNLRLTIAHHVSPHS
jgi:stearoyl-CoA desaturase (Delta-9 desaturase)